MTPESIKFLEDNKHHYDLLIRAGYVKHVDHSFKEQLLQVIRTEFQPAYNSNLWCGECVMDMIKFAWTQYEKMVESNRGIPERVTVVSEIPQIYKDLP